MNEAKPTSYEATTEYLKELRRTAGPKNVPASVMAKMRGAALLDLLGEPSTRAASAPGYSAKISKWNTYAKDQRMELVATMETVDEVRAAMIMEEDREILRFMIDKLEALEEPPSA